MTKEEIRKRLQEIRDLVNDIHDTHLQIPDEQCSCPIHKLINKVIELDVDILVSRRN